MVLKANRGHSEVKGGGGEEEDLRERTGVAKWRRSERYGGTRLWIALKV